VAARYVVFSHGKESGPWGRKITALAETARAEHFTVHSVDYRGIDAPEQRIARLVDTCRELQGELVLVGSSLGAYVTVSAASVLHARGVFLMAPAIYAPGLPPLRPRAVDCTMNVVHGWYDEVIPVDDAIRFAREYKAPLHILNDDHGLGSSIRRIKYLFEYFLVTLDLPPDGV
jgi:pimeloyl-ACP methyl ester carboxylesterase